MCDYSLHLVKSRPAKIADRLILTNFAYTPTVGFAAIEERDVAVCLLPGTEVAFNGDIRYAGFLGLFTRSAGSHVARFCQVNIGHPYAHHDALEFPDGRVVTLQQLKRGQEATVLQLPVQGRPEDTRYSEPADASRQPSETADASMQQELAG